MMDLLIKSVEIIDPVNGRFYGNIGIKGHKIEFVSEQNIEAKKIFEASGLIAAPGFIDIHMHESEVTGETANLEMFEHMARMGVTTAVGGNCGLNTCKKSATSYFDLLENSGIPINYVGFSGYGYSREQQGHELNRPISYKEFTDLVPLIRNDLEKGACGVSLGLEYVPGISTEEIIWLGKLVKEYPGKMISAHYRYDSDRSLEALAELIILSRETGVPLQISHIGSCNAFGQMDSALDMFDAALKAGVDISADVYPYNAFSTMIGSAVFDEGCFERLRISYNSLLVTEGKYRGHKCTEEIFLELRSQAPDTLLVAFVMDENEIITALKHPGIMIASDGFLRSGQGHPRASGAFPRAIGKYVREEKHLDLVEAVNKMTLLPARRLGLTQKGRIAAGYDADLVLFNYDTISDRSSYEKPAVPPEGIDHVLVSGNPVVSNSKYIGGDNGTVIRVG